MWYCKIGKPHSAPASINWNLNLLIDPQFSTAKTNDFAMTRGIFLWTWKSGFKHRRIIFQDQRPELTDEHIFDKTKCLWTRTTFFSTFFIFTRLPKPWKVSKKGNLKWHFPWRGGGSRVPLTYSETLPKALRTQALTALTSNFGLVCLVRWVWLARFGLVGLVW